jgi:hypothetical protein
MVDAKNKGENTRKPGMSATEIKHCDDIEDVWMR